MKNATFFGLLFLLPAMAFSQNGSICILPEAGLSSPVGDFKSVNVFAKQGIQAGLHLEKMWGKIGLGLYGGFDKHGIQFEDLVPAGNPGLPILRSEEIVQYNWKQYLLGIGPVLKLDLSKKFNIELMSKLGISKFSYPDFGKFVELGDPVNQVYTLYQTKNEEVKKKFNAMALSALRLNLRVTQRIDLSLSGNYLHVRNVLHSYSYLDAGLNPNMSAQELITSLRTAPTVSEVRKCYFNSIGATIGLSFNLGGKDNSNPKEKIDPPIPSYPADGATISVQEADSLTLEWLKEKRNVEKANYNLWLYKISDQKGKQDSLIYQTKTKRSLQAPLPNNIKLAADKSYRWRVQAVDDPALKACAGGCTSMEATFKVATVLSAQYYLLETENSGNYVPVTNQLNFVWPKYLEMGGKVNARIWNERSQAVFNAANFLLGGKGENYLAEPDGRCSIYLKQLPAGYYLLELKNERKQTYYLRFKHSRNDIPNKN